MIKVIVDNGYERVKLVYKEMGPHVSEYLEVMFNALTGLGFLRETIISGMEKIIEEEKKE